MFFIAYKVEENASFYLHLLIDTRSYLHTHTHIERERESMVSMNNLVVCAPLECETTEQMAASMEKAKSEGANIVELCIDALSVPIHNISQLERLIKLRTLPAIVSFRCVLLINFPH